MSKLSELAAVCRDFLATKCGAVSTVYVGTDREVHDFRTGFLRLRKVRVYLPTVTVTVVTDEPLTASAQEKFESALESCRPVGVSMRFSYLHRIPSNSGF